MDNKQKANDSIATNAVGTFAGMTLALIVFFIILPIGGCMMCVTCAMIQSKVQNTNVSSDPLHSRTQ